MIELNLLTEGHGILYSRVRTTFLKRFLIILVVLLPIAAIFYLSKELYNLQYIIEDEGQFIDLNIFLKGREDAEKEISQEKEIEPHKEVKSHTDIKSFEATAADESRSREEKIIEKGVESNFEVIAGTCILKESADHIVKRLKNAGFNPSIERRKVNFNMYAIWLGEFDSIEEIDKIRSGLNDIGNLNVQEIGGRYILKTSSVTSSKNAKNILRSVKERGISGRLIKIKEKREAFIVVAKEFNNYREAAVFKKSLKDNGFAGIISSISR